MRKLLILFCIGLFSFSLPVQAQTNKRFPQSRISTTEWQQYFDEVKTIPEAKIQEGRIQTLISIEGPDKSEAYYFTNPNHPAHPAAIKISAYADSSGETRAGVIGNYAGSKENFDPWFQWALGLVTQQRAKQ
jgi:hypothetical protein